ncbi:gliding motility protein GldC [Fulvivirgaceae bacterium BMA12]|uniref:Gliding motility protein GldC n=1 Tax=Agaribacillus aureus TaxID=3051825 RepID=A0ABT8L990_9BACT|nr:gliding motility protein GldC [Fulvivirgaceae bacterium BMA12]
MKSSEIKFTIELDDNRVPEKITWDATEKSGNDLAETNAINISLWDQENKNTLRIDLWTKEMTVFEMKRFYIDSLGGLAQNILKATGDEFMATEMNDLCEKLVAYLEKNPE